MQTNIPAPPAPPKKRRVWLWVIGTIVTLAVLGAVGETTNEPESVAPPIVFEDTEDTVDIGDDAQLGIARLAWDTALTQADQDAICDYYNTPPVGTTPELVRVFAEGAEISYADADRVLNQLLMEEC
jgi:hypothetical protein